ncbi:hypothetical protein AUC70_11865 [Methyloceanibacter stevinii]|uniref:HTH Mu-type domain-containing protein n=1 Tax=Methyloceanibacter stevinii TaxID=1774970 RepID=A0A1E3VJ66_9HYPH|nr:transposase domain-containing protein [Methyloceanibacter stevinii]ODR93552.1 hypothetical protein AUC70_11865 [Methyloceanibacter stevinii]
MTWVTVQDLVEVGAGALPTDERALGRYIERHGWRDDAARARLKSGQGGGWEYHYTLLPTDVQCRVLARAQQGAQSEADRNEQAKAEELWARFERLPKGVRDKAEKRLVAVKQVRDLRRGGIDATTAVALAAADHGVSATTLWSWLRLVEGLDEAHWLPVLAPRHAGRTSTVECSAEAWAFLKADYLRPEQPSFTACYRRMKEAAEQHGWAPIPSAKTLQRRVNREVPRGARVLARGGRDTAKAIFPHQTRDRSGFMAMQAVNADGHRFDVFVKWPDGEVSRPLMVAVQDLYSGMIVGHRLAKTENWTAVRGAFADMMESWGIPEQAWLDNGRAFASKWLTGGMANRFRFKIKDDEPVGLLKAVGVQVHWTTPYHGQAKPIERAFRDLCEEIAKHPACQGAYTGNRPDAKPDNYGAKAVPFEEFRKLVAAEIARHNRRDGRRTAVAHGRSFFETFKDGLERALVTRATEAQLRMFLMAAEGVTARKPTGEVQLAGNRYWADQLVDVAGRKVVVRFDPDDLLSSVAVYSLDGRFIATAPCIEASGFADIDKAKEHARMRRAWLKRQRECLDLENRMSLDELARLFRDAPPDDDKPEPSVLRLAVNETPRPAEVDATDNERASTSFGRAVAAMDSGGDVLQFPTGKEKGAES